MEFPLGCLSMYMYIGYAFLTLFLRTKFFSPFDGDWSFYSLLKFEAEILLLPSLLLYVLVLFAGIGIGSFFFFFFKF